MASKVETILEEIKGLTLLEASDLVKKMEEAFGVSAAAAAPVMMAGGAAAAGGCAGGGKDGIRRRPHRSRREQDQRDQGGPRSHQPGLERSQGPGRWRSQDGERGRQQGRGGHDQEEVRRRRSQGRDQVVAARERPDAGLQRNSRTRALLWNSEPQNTSFPDRRGGCLSAPLRSGVCLEGDGP